MGLDSLMAIDLRNRLQKALGRTLPSPVVFNYPNIRALATFLAGAAPSPVSPAPIHRGGLRRAAAGGDGDSGSLRRGGRGAARDAGGGPRSRRRLMSGPSLSVAKQALLALEQMRERLAAAEQAGREPVAIIGIGLRVPGANDLEGFWTLLRDGVDATSDIPR